MFFTQRHQFGTAFKWEWWWIVGRKLTGRFLFLRKIFGADNKTTANREVNFAVDNFFVAVQCNQRNPLSLLYPRP